MKPTADIDQQLAEAQRLHDSGELEKAVAAYQSVCALNPALADAHYKLGTVLQHLGRIPDAIAAYSLALKAEPNHLHARSDLSVAFLAAGQLEDALASCDKAIEQDPSYAIAHYNRGVVLRQLGKLDLAADAFRKTIEFDSSYAEAFNNLGAVLQALGKAEEAIPYFRRAVEIKPSYLDAHSNLGLALLELGQNELARVHLLRAYELAPAFFHFRYRADLMLPIIPASVAAISEAREQYRVNLKTLTEMPGQLGDLRGFNLANSYYLAYHNEDNRGVMEMLAAHFRFKAPALNFHAPNIADYKGPSSGRIRVGFVSTFFSNHTIGKLYQGFIKRLDRTRLECVIIHTPDTRRDHVSAYIEKLADKTIILPAKLSAQHQVLADERLDVLFYPDVGMAPKTYWLAYARLAPVQVVSWGHPESTGLDTIDYFLSADVLEPPHAEKMYTERLIRLSRLPCYYTPFSAPSNIGTRASLGLPDEGRIYTCPQSLFKIHPEFDDVLAEIATRDPQGHIVLLEGATREWTTLLKQRWQRHHEILLHRVLFLPRMPLERFMELIGHSDVLLDPIHFGSGNSFYEAMVYCKPIITWPGRFMRGRVVAAGYKQMNIHDAPIVDRPEDYAALAVALSKDVERHRALCEELKIGSKELFADLGAVRELEKFLIAAVEAAAAGRKLPTGWPLNKTEVH